MGPLDVTAAVPLSVRVVLILACDRDGHLATEFPASDPDIDPLPGVPQREVFPIRSKAGGEYPLHPLADAGGEAAAGLLRVQDSCKSTSPTGVPELRTVDEDVSYSLDPGRGVEQSTVGQELEIIDELSCHLRRSIGAG